MTRRTLYHLAVSIAVLVLCTIGGIRLGAAACTANLCHECVQHAVIFTVGPISVTCKNYQVSATDTNARQQANLMRFTTQMGGALTVHQIEDVYVIIYNTGAHTYSCVGNEVVDDTYLGGCATATVAATSTVDRRFCANPTTGLGLAGSWNVGEDYNH